MKIEFLLCPSHPARAQEYIATLLSSTSITADSSVDQSNVPVVRSIQILPSSLSEGQPNHHRLHLMPILLRTESGGELCPEEVHGFGELSTTKEDVTPDLGRVGGKVPGTIPT